MSGFFSWIKRLFAGRPAARPTLNESVVSTICALAIDTGRAVFATIDDDGNIIIKLEADAPQADVAKTEADTDAH